ncbi:MAG TPA: hypothetical protein VJ603_09590 [Paucimonas sp.]|nr:hypothetical protein [Paucimonas sp.]HJW55967.1 hypothetical protein [Burkholderiaceae bacterium]
MSAIDQQPTVLQAAGHLGRLLPHAAGVAVSLSAVTYYAGWRDASAYFIELGAPWAVSMLPATSFLYLSAELVTVVLLVAFFSVHAVATDMTGLKGVTRASIGVFVLSIIMAAIARWFPSAWLSTKSVWHLTTAVGFLFAVGGGMILGEAAVHLSESEMRWSPRHAYLIYTAIFVGIYVAPSQVGTARARFHLDAVADALPSVKLANALPNQSWFMVSVMNDRALAMERSSKARPPQFRVVSVSEVASIEAVAKKHPSGALP